jgi:hypothetical protein
LTNVATSSNSYFNPQMSQPGTVELYREKSDSSDTRPYLADSGSDTDTIPEMDLMVQDILDPEPQPISDLDRVIRDGIRVPRLRSIPDITLKSMEAYPNALPSVHSFLPKPDPLDEGMPPPAPLRRQDRVNFKQNRLAYGRSDYPRSSNIPDSTSSIATGESIPSLSQMDVSSNSQVTSEPSFKPRRKKFVPLISRRVKNRFFRSSS